MPCADPINLGYDTTPTHPCTRIGVDPVSVEVCSAWDYLRVRSVAVQKNNQLVTLLNRLNQLVKEGKATWDAATNAAYDLQLGAWDTFQEFTKEYYTVYHVFSTGPLNMLGPAEATSKIALLAEQLHGAVCDVKGALEKAGDAVPEDPPPPKEPLSISETFVAFTKDVVEGIGYILVGGLLLAVGYAAFTRWRGVR